MTIVGIDCATLPKKTGLALATFSKGRLLIDECRIAYVRSPVSAQIYSWVQDVGPALLAVDSPLGWPSALGKTLSTHLAGRSISQDSDQLFRRYTDQVVRKLLGKAPLEVGADRIARTAVVALSLLAGLSELVGKEIPLASRAVPGSGIRAIETYPAGTLRAYERMGKVRATGNVDARKRALLKVLERDGRIRFSPGSRKTLANEHVLDSVLCVVAAMDFVEGHVISPGSGMESRLARKEGWIWIRDPEA